MPTTTTRLATNRSTYCVTEHDGEYTLTIEDTANEWLQPYTDQTFEISEPTPWPPALYDRPTFRFRNQRSGIGGSKFLQTGVVKSIERETSVALATEPANE